jgi:hypothetical protein
MAKSRTFIELMQYIIAIIKRSWDTRVFCFQNATKFFIVSPPAKFHTAA